MISDPRPLALDALHRLGCGAAHDQVVGVGQSYGRAACKGEGSPMSSSMVNFIAIMVRRFGAMSLKPC
ncbi:MAG TPA: hypothetical protein VE462_02455 [Propionibacteriaceae bacterium]|jgi:hypothetical protein|nr:hypothetical protein [Propionibacteriaceae bacterium]